MKPPTLVATCHCEQGTIQLQFSLDIPRSNGKVGYPKVDYAALQLITSKVKIEVIPADMGRDKLAITLPAADAVELMGGREPCTETFDCIYRKLCERKRFPLPKQEILGGGEKSMTAQGQTKKPGSHSHEKHK
jgi:hypothetical protein